MNIFYLKLPRHIYIIALQKQQMANSQ
jgi:hypothetical protein